MRCLATNLRAPAVLPCLLTHIRSPVILPRLQIVDLALALASHQEGNQQRFAGFSSFVAYSADAAQATMEETHRNASNTVSRHVQKDSFSSWPIMAAVSVDRSRRALCICKAKIWGRLSL
jgi:hypothetical protein